MKTILLFFAIIFSSNLFAQNFLVPIKGDTVFFENDFEVNHKESAKWREIRIDGKAYAVNKIQILQSANIFYFNVDRRHLWKRVVTGKINVFALNDKDTMADRNGFVNKKLFIQKTDDDYVYILNNKNLLSLCGDDTILNENITHKMDVNNTGKGIGISSAFIAGGSGFALLYTGFLALINSGRSESYNYRNVANISLVGIVVGGSGSIIGSVLSSSSKKTSLEPIYYYNQK